MTENTEPSVGVLPEVASDGANPFADSSDQRKNSLLGSTLLNPKRSLLLEWLTKLEILDVDRERAEQWKALGWEVYQRKALLLAAARDLEENNISNPMKLAATDIFVEKAIGFLTERGNLMYKCGAGTSVLAIFLLLGVAGFVYQADTKDLLHVQTSSQEVSAGYLTILILKSITAGAFVVAVAYFFVSLPRALLHEATVLFSRRHSLRFGRLFVYLMNETMTRKDLEAIFNWNTEFSTAFKDIKAEDITKSPLSRLAEAPAEVLKVLTELYKETIKEARERKETQK